MISGPPTPPPDEPGEPNAAGGRPPPPLPPPVPPSGPGGPEPGVPQGKRKRDALPLIIVGTVLAVLAAVCCLGGALVLFDRRTTPEPSPTPPPLPTPQSGPPQPSLGPSGSAGGGNPLRLDIRLRSAAE